MNFDAASQMPNLFLADLGSEHALNPVMIREACYSIRRNREQWLLSQRTRSLLEMIAYTAEQWLDPEYGFRKVALRAGPAETGFPLGVLARGLDQFFRSLTLENLEALIAQDLGDLRRLDDFTTTAAELRHQRSAVARGPALLAHIAAGNIPNPTLFSMTLGLMVKSAQFIKCASRASLLPRLYAHSLAATESKLGACLELAVWPGGSETLEEALFLESDCVTATGSDEALRSIRNRLPLKTRFLGYGSRLSLGYIAEDALSSYAVKRLARDAASDIAAWNQMGCLSPHVYYVEPDGVVSPEGFAEKLAQELEAREATDPRGEISMEESAHISQRRAVYEARAAFASSAPAERNRRQSVFFEATHTPTLWKSPESTAWTVIHDTDPRFEPSCGNRFVYVKPARKLAEVLQHVEPFRSHLSTVALAASEIRATELARELARWGVPRVCRIGQMQTPPPTWRHDGRPALGDLVTWTDLEQ